MQPIEDGRRHPYPPPGKPSLNVLLTGATGVVGRALLPNLGMHNVICLLHVTAMSAPGLKALRGDIRLPCLGLSRRDFKELSAVIDVIVHAAADTSFGAESALVETNVAGTARIVELAQEAEARLVYVSTAFSAVGTDGDSAALAYARTKANAEELVRASGLPAVVVRPSIIVGDSRTGHIAKHQGFHKLLGAMMRGLLPIVPLDPSRLLDFVPQDVVAKNIADLLDKNSDRTDLWLTAGSRALQLGAVASEIHAAAVELGRPIPPVRFVDEDLYERLIVPVFLEAVPAPTRKLIKTLAEQLTPYVAAQGPFPSDVGELPDPVHTLRASVRRWAKASGFRPRDASGALR
ncbi:SDR family oxidoreductase [Streptomyces sp. NPDC058000]|uniref:SDR family oxidoreductase n=1 Tax=Streptomyces sp. NPDC058000 TaxID=3346299 RepID=UPI0036ED01A6